MIPNARPRGSRPDLGDLSEQALVAQARDRDEGAVRELIRRLNPRLFRVARGLVDSDAEAEEALQEAYLSAFTHLDAFRGEARFSTWVTRIVVNAAGMARRRRRPTEEYDTVTEERTGAGVVVPFPGSDGEGPEAALGRSEIRSLLQAAVAALPPDLRVVFLLREAEGMSVLAVARDLRLNPITVKTRLFRARRQLRARLEAEMRGGFEAVFPFDGARCTGMADRVIRALQDGGHL